MSSPFAGMTTLQVSDGRSSMDAGGPRRSCDGRKSTDGRTGAEGSATRASGEGAAPSASRAQHDH
eukprot:1853531-Pyramimonas_sp.AAC.1